MDIRQQQKDNGLSLLQGVVLDMVASGKTARQIAEAIGTTPTEAAKMAYDLLDSEISTDTDQRRKLQVYRLERMVDALWDRVMKNANKDDVKNLREILSDLNVLLALNKEQDASMTARMHTHQFAVYMSSLLGLIKVFQLLAPTLMTAEQWSAWTADQLEIAQVQMELPEIEA